MTDPTEPSPAGEQPDTHIEQTTRQLGELFPKIFAPMPAGEILSAEQWNNVVSWPFDEGVRKQLTGSHEALRRERDEAVRVADKTTLLLRDEVLRFKQLEDERDRLIRDLATAEVISKATMLAVKEAAEQRDAAQRERDRHADVIEKILAALPDNSPCKFEETSYSVVDDVRDLVQAATLGEAAILGKSTAEHAVLGSLESATPPWSE